MNRPDSGSPPHDSIRSETALEPDTTQHVICASYAQDLADKLARDCRAVMTAPFYRKLFPQAALAGGKQSVQEFTTQANGFRLATSVGGVLTGRGADLIIIDDPLKPDKALSDTRRNAVNHWFDNTVYTRLNDKVNGAIVVIMQRLHEDDLVGHVLEQGAWRWCACRQSQKRGRLSSSRR